MLVKPLRKKILVAENATTHKQSESGIILESVNSVRDSKTATVLAIGSEVTNVIVGDKVLIDWSKGVVVKVDDAQRVMISEDDIIGVIE